MRKTIWLSFFCCGAEIKRNLINLVHWAHHYPHQWFNLMLLFSLLYSTSMLIFLSFHVYHHHHRHEQKRAHHILYMIVSFILRLLKGKHKGTNRIIR